MNPSQNLSPKPGQTVWVIDLILEDSSSKPKPVPRGSVKERVFVKVIRNYLGKYRERWVLQLPGGVDSWREIAWHPTRVHLTRDAAKAALEERIDAMISKLQTLRATI